MENTENQGEELVSAGVPAETGVTEEVREAVRRQKRESFRKTLLYRVFKAKYLYLALVPTFALLGVFCYVPFVQAFIRSMYDWNGINYAKFIGFKNFAELFTKDELWWPSFCNMLIITAVDIAKCLIITTALAIILNRVWSKRSQYVFRVLIILPAVIPGMVSTLLWKSFVAEYGIINEMLRAVGLSAWTHQWLGEEGTALFTILGIMGFPWVNGANTLILLAGLMNVDQSIYDAASLDGIKWYQKIFRIELPLISSQVKIILLMQIIGSIQSYENIQVITNGGPGMATYVPGLMLYNSAFRYSRFGYASAIGVVMFFMIIVFSIFNQKLSGGGEKNA